MRSPVKLIAEGNRLVDAQHRVIVPEVQAYSIHNPAFENLKQLSAKDDGGEANAARLALAWNMHDDLIKFVKELADIWPLFMQGKEMPMGLSMTAHRAASLIAQATGKPQIGATVREEDKDENRTIKITVEGGVVRHVDGLPDGWLYEIDDQDGE